nr:WxL domain-containing protein [Enterococcus sp. DIV0212c]MBO1354576.1 WxL domain-containing protein [Enterococcus sp. DIV0212c]
MTVHAEKSNGETENSGVGNEVTGTSDGKGATSQAHMTLMPGDGATDPTDPIVPTDPEEPGGGTGNKGPLTIDNVTPLEFGEHKLAGGESIYSTTSKKPNVQVTDSRGEGKGWTLQITSSEFKDIKDSKKILKGAVLTLPIGTLQTTTGNVSEKPESKEVKLNTDKPSTENLLVAKAKAGMGTWANEFDAKAVTVKVPAGNFAGEYVSTLTWTMLDAPKA